MTLRDILQNAEPDEVAALRDALAKAPVSAKELRTPPLPTDELRALRMRYEAAAARVLEERTRLGRELAAAQAAQARATADMGRINAAIGSLDAEVGAELDDVRRAAYAGRLADVDAAVVALRREAEELTVDVVSRPTSPGKAEQFSNGASVEARRAALFALAELVLHRAAQAAFTTPAELAAFISEERGKLPTLESAADVRRRVEGERMARADAEALSA